MLKNKNIKKTRSSFSTGKSFLFPFSFPFSPFSFFLSLLCILPSSLSPATLTVKQDGTGDFTNIQEAIGAAAVNDTILVWPGTYYENISFFGKDLVLASLFLTTGDRQYINQTIIDGNKNGTVITLQDNETLVSVICGFTIQNGKKDFSSAYWNRMGSGIMLFQSALQIRNNIIKNNESFGGGGICSLDGTAKMYGNVIKSNHSYLAGGGILHVNESTPFFFDTVQLNSIYLNFGHLGCDIFVRSINEPQTIELDTITVFNPDLYFVFSSDGYYQPMNDLVVNARYQKIEPVEADLYVSPLGNNQNSGLNPEEPLQSICFAMTKIQPDSLVQRTINIMPGIYSPRGTCERLPIGGRSNIRLSGENTDNTIVDCQYESFFYSGRFMQQTTIENLTVKNGFGALLSPSGITDGGIQIYQTEKVKISNVKIEETKDAFHQCIFCYFPDSVWINNFQCLNSIGVQPIEFIRTMDDFPMHVRIENIRIHGNRYYVFDQLFGGYKNLIIFGGNENDEIVTGKVINAEITNNVSWDTWFSNNCGAGFLTSKRAKLDIVNATIGGNRDSTNLPGTNSTVEGSEVNIYNSIFYNNNSPDIYVYADNAVNDPAEINFHYTLFENGPAGIIDGAGNTIVNWGEGILDEDPKWDVFGANPYALMSTSPCINTGTPMYEEGMEPPYIKEENGKYILYTHGYDTIHLPATDLAGNPRIAYGRIDMGAYEFADTTVNIMKRPPKYLGGEIKVMPNPFQQSTAIKFTLLKEGRCVVKIHDLNGRLIKTLLDTFTVPGNFNMRWHADDDYGNKIPSGHYIINVVFEGENVGSVKVWRR
ncbi:MAG: hypothetical protein B6I19_05490 [Bacteroidetes bacterium 4572_114]|nr:MAG: hypothetical protein B6I19_05490 [Bacteroidetes bacterium 4572_114]